MIKESFMVPVIVMYTFPIVGYDYNSVSVCAYVAFIQFLVENLVINADMQAFIYVTDRWALLMHF